VQFTFIITALTMKYRRQRESLPVKRIGLIRPVIVLQFDSFVDLKITLESNSPDHFFDDGAERKK